MNLSALFPTPKGNSGLSTAADLLDLKNSASFDGFAAIAEEAFAEIAPAEEPADEAEPGNSLPVEPGNLLPAMTLPQSPLVQPAPVDPVEQQSPPAKLNQMDVPAIAILAPEGELKVATTLPPEKEPRTVTSTFAASPDVDGQLANAALKIPNSADATAAPSAPARPEGSSPAKVGQTVQQSVDLKQATTNLPISNDEPKSGSGSAEISTPSPVQHTAYQSAPLAISMQAQTLTTDAPGQTQNFVNQTPSIVAHDFETLVSRLAEAREYARPARAEMVVPHAEFGAVSVLFEHAGKELRVSMASADADFAPAVQAAMIDRPVTPVVETHRADAQQSRQDSGSSSGGSSNQSQTSSQTDSQRQDRSRAGQLTAQQKSDDSHQFNAQTSHQSQPRGRFA